MSIKYVEYLEADGNSYFELPAGTITWNSNSGIEVQYYHDAYVGGSYLIGAYGKNGNTSIYTYYEQLGILMFEQKFTKNWYTNEYTANIQPYVHTIKIDKNGRTFDGVTESITWSEPESWIFERINVSPVRIFGQGSNQGDNYKYVALQGTRIYYVKIYNGDEVVHYFRPCLKGNTPCIYDEISKTFYYNQGTGTFGYGKALNTLHLFANNNQGTAENLGSYRLYNMKIEGDSEGVESGVDYVDCLIGDNDSWIDTGIVAKSNYKIEATFTSTVDRYSYYTPEQKSFSAIWGASTSTGYSYDREPYGVSLSFKDTSVHVKNGGVLSSPVGISVSCLNKKYTHNVIVSENVTNVNNLYLFAINFNGVTYNYAENTTKIYDFKIYNAQETLIQHLKPCLDIEGVPCMYDEVSKQYFHNQGTGTFGYKKKLRDFQPVLDSNGIPTLMDKVNKKYYYDKNGNLFGCAEQSEYTRVGYLEGDGNSYINTGIYANPQYKIETTISDDTQDNYENYFGVSVSGLITGVNRRRDVLMINFNYNSKMTAVDYPLGKHKIYIDANKIYIDDVLSGTASESTNTTIFESTMLLWTQWLASSTTSSCSTIKIHYFKMWNENNILVFDGIPVLDSEGTPCMYDLVTETFFYNQGTGTFGYGIEELECPKADYVEYLEAPTSPPPTDCRFDTGIPFDNTYSKIELKIDRNTNHSYGILINTSNEHYSLSSFSLRWNYGVMFASGKVNGASTGNVQIDDYGGALTTASEITLTYTPYKWTYNGVDYPMTTGTLDNSTGNLMLFYSDMCYNRLISWKVWDKDNNLIQHLQPCLDNNGVSCLYDIVNDNFIYSNYTYETGKSIGYTPIKYIETNGTQYIDTEVVPTDNTDIDMVARAVAKEYTQVEYLQSDGACYIPTGLTVTGTTDYDMEIKYEVDTSVTGVIVGECDSNNIGNSTKQFGLLNRANLWIVYAQFENYTDNNGIVTFTKNIMIANGNTPNRNNISMFGNADGKQCSVSKIYYVKIFDTEDNLVNYFIPILDAEGVPCMYDEINKTYFYNQGTGVFTYGDAVDKNYLMNDFYIESTYKYKEIDTTVEPNLTANEGATLTLGSTYMAYLSEEELEQATKNGWIIE